jgi:hypothetical protein
MSPIAQALERVTEKISSSSQSAISDMVADFSRQLQGNVGQNMVGLTETLAELRLALTAVIDRMAATGTGLSDQLGQSVSELRQAAIDMASAMRDASARTESGLEASRKMLEEQLTHVGTGIAQEAQAASIPAETRIRDAAGDLASVVANIGVNLSGTVASLTQELMNLSEQMRSVESRISSHRDAL